MRQTVIARQRLIAALERAHKGLTVRELAPRVGRNRNTVQQQLYGLLGDGVVERTRGVDGIWRFKLTGAPLPDSPARARLVADAFSPYDHRRLTDAVSRLPATPRPALDEGVDA